MTATTPPLPDLLRAAADWLDPRETCIPKIGGRLIPKQEVQNALRAAADRLEAEQPAPGVTRHKVTQTGEHFCEHFCEERKRLTAEVCRTFAGAAEEEMKRELQRLRDENAKQLDELVAERNTVRRLELELRSAWKWRDRAEWLLGEMRKEAT